MAKPIIFTGDSVRQILAGTKTQTRRVMKPQPVLEKGLWRWGGAGWSDGMGYVPVMPGHSLETRNPYGRLGAQLWVRETWGLMWPEDCDNGVVEDEDGEERLIRDDECVIKYRATDPYAAWAGVDGEETTMWRSPFFMPRWASRLTLELTRVRVEQVQHISEADAVAEGGGGLSSGPMEPYEADGYTAVDEYAELWDELNAKRGFPWKSNPWCWVLDFSVAEVKGEADDA